MSQARSLKDTSQPEFEEKLNRLKELRDLRTGYLDKISAIKNNIKGLDFKSEVRGFATQPEHDMHGELTYAFIDSVPSELMQYVAG